MKKQSILTLLLVLFAYFFSFLMYDKLPNLVPSHWNAVGQVDGHMSKGASVIFFLSLITLLPLFLNYFPKLDPKYASIKKFEGEFGWFIVFFTAFFVGLYIFTIFYALGYEYPVQYFIFPGLTALFFSIGSMMRNVKSNYSIGFRLPWTLHSEENWNKTHQVAAKSFMYGSLFFIPALLLGNYSSAGFMVILLVIVMYPIVFSYQLHKRGI